MLSLLAQQAEAATEQQVAATSGWFIFWTILAVIFVPYIAGSFLANALKLKDFSSRIGTVLFCITAALTPFCYQLTQAPEGQKVSTTFAQSFRLGIDLAGGTNLVYEVKRDELDREKLEDLDRAMDNMVGAIIRRVNPSGTEEVTVRRVGADRIEIIISGKDQDYVAEMKDRITRLGTLEFEILATEQGAHKAFTKQARNQKDDSVLDAANREVARWVDVVPGEEITNGGPVLPALTRPIERTDEEKEAAAAKGIKLPTQQVLVAISPENEEVTGKYLVRATEQLNPNGQLVVGFRFDPIGAGRFFELTSKHRPLTDDSRYRLAILLDGKVQSAPSLKSAIGAQGVIEGNFTREEIRSLVSVLNAGALEIPLNTTPVSEFTISPLLGQNVREKGVTAIVVSAVVVVAFMAIYYLKAGVIAVLCLLLNMLLIMGTMVFVQGTFTLPGLAGLVLTIGMAVDANVLIFERIREEINRGASTRMAIHNGFEKAFSAIVDSNITTLIVAVILFMIGTDQVKGFAVTLFIGIVMSMFSALYFGRLVFELLEQKRLLRNLPMLAIVKSPNFDLVGKQSIAVVVSGVLIFGGMASFAYRWLDNLDIDFRGGTMVTFEFVEPQQLADGEGKTGFRKSLEEKFGTSITIERLTREDEDQASDAGRRWRLRTTNQLVKEVQQGLTEALSSNFELRRVILEPAGVSTIAADDEDESFAGGLQAYLRFSDSAKDAAVPPPEPAEGDDPVIPTNEISVGTFARKLTAALHELDGGEDRYPNPENLFVVEGTIGTGLKADDTAVKKFSGMLLRVRAVAADTGDDVSEEGDVEAASAVPAIAQADLEAALTAISNDKTPLFEEVSKFSSAVGLEMQIDALIAMLASLAAIIVYIWFRFQRVTFGFAAVVALVHDVLVVLGLVALASLLSGYSVGSLLMLYDFKINLPMIAAFLTIVGYSLNDTIVIFDRIREVRGKNPALTTEMINRSLNQTLARTVLTSLTTFGVVAILYVLGGEGIHGFAFCLLIGVLVGTYSSIFVASPVLLWLMNREGSSSANPA